MQQQFITYAHFGAGMIDEYHLRLLAIQKYANGFFAKFVIYENKYRQFIIRELAATFECILWCQSIMCVKMQERIYVYTLMRETDLRYVVCVTYMMGARVGIVDSHLFWHGFVNLIVYIYTKICE